MGKAAGGAGVFRMSRVPVSLARVGQTKAGTGWRHSQLTAFPLCPSSPHALDPAFSDCHEIWVPSWLRLSPAG